jgi:hypothetical protein
MNHALIVAFSFLTFVPIICAQNNAIDRSSVEKALRRDPDNWMAQDLFRKASSRQERGNSPGLALIYYGNARGHFLSSTDGGSIGGLARAASAIRRLRKEAANERLLPLTIMTGNMVTLESLPIIAKVAHDYYAFINDDARCLGPGEFMYGIDRLPADTSICIGAPNLPGKKIVSFSIIKRKKFCFAIISTVNDPESVAILKKRNSSLSQELRAIIDNSEVRKCDLRIVVLHESRENIAGYAGSIAGADIILCEGIDKGSMAARKPDGFDGAIVVPAPVDGACVGCLTINFDEKKKNVSYDNRWVPLTEEIAPDKTVAAMMAPLMPKMRPVRMDSGKMPLSIEGFAFLPNEKTNVAVKTAESLLEIPLENKAVAIGTPALALTSGNVAYGYSTMRDGCAPLAVFNPLDRVSTKIVDSMNVREVIFAPGEKWIYCAAADCGDTMTGIYRIRFDGGTRYPVVVWKNATQNNIAFSPNSPEMTFCSDRDGSWQLYLTNLEGDHPLRLTDDDYDHRKPLFSPNGSYIAYLSNRASVDGSTDLWIYDRAKAGHVRITENMNVDDFCWLDNSRKIIISSGLDFPELKVVDIMTGSVTKFLRPLLQAPEVPYGEKNPRMVNWNGKKRVVYLRDFDDGRKRLYWSAIDGSDDQLLVNEE